MQKLYSSNFIKGIEKFIKTNLFFANVVSICIIPISSQLKRMMMQALVLSHYLMMSWGSNAVIGFFCWEFPMLALCQPMLKIRPCHLLRHHIFPHLSCWINMKLQTVKLEWKRIFFMLKKSSSRFILFWLIFLCSF